MTKVVGVIDEDPFDFRTWSGSSRYFFGALEKKGVLAGAVSAQTNNLVRRLYQVKNFDPDIAKWKFQFRLDVDYYNRMANSGARNIRALDLTDVDVLLQIGAWYDLSQVGARKRISYHDGNLAALLKSPYGHPKISRSRINNALSYEKNLYSKLDLMFPMSKWLADSFVRDFSVPAKKLVPVGAGINLSNIGDVSNRSYDVPTILMVGKDFKRKGGDVLMAAFSKLRKKHPSARLVLVGPQIDSPPHGVYCTGFISKNTPDGLNQLLEIYTQATIYVLPSLYEPFGISLAEAMAHKLPCIGSNNFAMPEIIEDKVTGFLVPPGDVDSLANALDELVSSEKLCREMGEAGYRRYIENYTWDVVTSKILAAV